MLTTVLVPLDGSPLAERALPYAAALARASQARLVLLHVAPRRGEGEGEGAASAGLTRLLEKVRGTGIRAELQVESAREGDVARAIVESAGDLIVLSTHGRGGLGRWLRGSVADEVVRTAAVPVLLVPPACQRAWPEEGPRRILVPLDGSELAEVALEPAVELAKLAGADLHLLQVVNPPYFALYPGALTYIPFDPQAELAAAHISLERVATRLRAGGQAVQVHARLGYPASELAAFAREEAVDLIVMATHGRSGVARLVMGSVASETLQRASVPVLLVRPAAMRHEVAEPAEAPAAAAPSSEEPCVTISFSARELALLRRGLDSLRQSLAHDADLAGAVEALLARIAEAERTLVTPRHPRTQADKEVKHGAPEGNGSPA